MLETQPSDRGRNPNPEASSQRHGAVLAVASVASFMVALDLLVVTTALDAIRRDLDVDASTLQWTVTAYGLCFASLLMAGAALGNRLGRRRMLMIGLFVFVFGSVAAALSGGVGWLIAARVVQGAGSAIVLPVSLAIVASAYPPERRGAAIGTLEGITGLAVIAGPLVGGVITERLAWEWIFWSNVPMGLAAIPFVYHLIEETRSDSVRIDFPGAGLVATGTFGLVWGLARGNDVGWVSTEATLAVVSGGASWLAFLSWQRRATHPMLPLYLFRSRSFSCGAFAAASLSAALYASVFVMAQMLQITLGLDALETGVRLVPWTATLIVVAPLAGRAGDRWGPRPVLVTGLVGSALGFSWLAVLVEPGVGYGTILPPLLLMGVGVSAALPVSQSAILGAAPESEMGTAAGVTNMLQEIGGAVGVAIAVAVFLLVGDYSTPSQASTGFAHALVACAVLATIGAVGAAALPRRRDELVEAAGSPPA